MEALEELYGSDDSEGAIDNAVQDEKLSPPCKRARRDKSGSAASVPGRRALRGVERDNWRRALLAEGLEQFQNDSAMWPTSCQAEERKRQWEWFAEVCNREFAVELSGGEHGLYIYGSEACNMWVATSDIDCNMWTRQRIPKFFVRLKGAILAADASARVEIIAGARVPVAKIYAGGQHFDVTHEYGTDNPIVQHHKDVLLWVQRWNTQNGAVRYL